MALIDRIKERTGTDLSDAELNAMIASIAAELDARLGPVGPVTIELGDPTDPDARTNETLRLSRPIGAGTVTVTEIEPGNSGAAGDALVLDASDYRLLHGGRTLQRLTTGPNGRRYWAPLVRLTYTPTGALQSGRDEATIKLVQLDLSYRGLIKSERAGDYQWQGSVSADSYAAERESIFAALVQARGMVMA